MNKKLPFIILLIVFVIILIFAIKDGDINTRININGVDINQNDVSVYHSKYSSTSTCTDINNKATIDCDCDIVINNKHYEYNNTINAVSCDNSSDFCSNLCSMFVEALKNK